MVTLEERFRAWSPSADYFTSEPADHNDRCPRGRGCWGEDMPATCRWYTCRYCKTHNQIGFVMVEWRSGNGALIRFCSRQHAIAFVELVELHISIKEMWGPLQDD